MIRTLFSTIHHHLHQQLPKQNIRCSPLVVTQQRAYYLSTILNSKKNVDYSRVPVLDESDLDEQFVRGSGPGGQAVNKTNNCIVLRHKPTGFIVKCHLHRSASSNRKEARRLMIERLDEHFNGEESVENQLKRLDMKKSLSNSSKRKKIDEMKKKWKERENIE